MNNTYYGKFKSYDTTEILWRDFCDQGVMNYFVHKSKYQWLDVSWSNKIKVKGGNISIANIMVAYTF